ncbi:MAG: hypothetical protein MZV63_00895 [Marinilabiliales bacterium]|nr:hypothetical protein [Marinilabiliales bacterium]
MRGGSWSACPSFEDLPVAGTERKADETRRTVINAYQTSKGEVFLKRQCMHCNEPACTAACLTKAMYQEPRKGRLSGAGRNAWGAVIAWYPVLLMSQSSNTTAPNPKIEKCAYVLSTGFRRASIPACVGKCPTEAIVFGTRSELITEARRRINDRS